MNNRIFITCFLAGISFPVSAALPNEEKSLFLIVAEPFHRQLDLSSPVFIYEMRRNFPFSAGKIQSPVDFVRVYHEYELALFGSKQEHGVTVTVIHAGSPYDSSILHMDYCGRCLSDPEIYFLGETEEPTLLFTFQDPDIDATLFWKLGLLTGAIEEGSPQDYLLVHSAGMPGGLVSGGDSLTVYRDPESRQVVSENNTFLGWDLPEGYEPGPEESIAQLVNNAEIRVIGSESLNSASGRSYYIQNKRSGAWHRHEFSGSGTRALRAFGRWIAVEEAHSAPQTGSLSRYLVDVDPSNERFMHPWARHEYFGIRPAGRLFLYDTFNKVQIDIDVRGRYFRSVDSEVLLVADEHVYFHEENTIFRARLDVGSGQITERKQLGGKPQSHWAFAGEPGTWRDTYPVRASVWEALNSDLVTGIAFLDEEFTEASQDDQRELLSGLMEYFTDYPDIPEVRSQIVSFLVRHYANRDLPDAYHRPRYFTLVMERQNLYATVINDAAKEALSGRLVRATDRLTGEDLLLMGIHEIDGIGTLVNVIIENFVLPEAMDNERYRHASGREIQGLFYGNELHAFIVAARAGDSHASQILLRHYDSLDGIARAMNLHWLSLVRQPAVINYLLNNVFSDEWLPQSGVYAPVAVKSAEALALMFGGYPYPDFAREARYDIRQAPLLARQWVVDNIDARLLEQAGVMPDAGENP